MKVLVTGASGFLGKTLLHKLANSNYDCIGISKSSSSIINEIKISKCDITKKDQITEVVKKHNPDVVIHLASYTGNVECEKNPDNAFSTNVLGTLNVLDSIRNSRAKIIFASSREIYGNVSKPANENIKPGPININGFTKMLGENLIHNFNQNYKIPFIILRFTNFYGFENSHRGVSLMIKKAVEGNSITIYGGNQIFDPIHIEDATQAILRSIKYNRSDIFNIGTNEPTTPKKILFKLEKILKKKIKKRFEDYRDFEVRKFYVDIRKARVKLHFTPKFNLDSGLHDFVKNLKNVSW